MNKIKDFFYNKNDLIIVLLILLLAAGIIYYHAEKIMNYPHTLAAQPTVTESVQTTDISSAEDTANSGESDGQTDEESEKED